MTKQSNAARRRDAAAKPVVVLNPRYEGATPEAVGRALLRHDPEADGGKAEDKPSGIIGEPVIQSSI